MKNTGHLEDQPRKSNIWLINFQEQGDKEIILVPSLWVIPVHQPEHPVSCIEPELAIRFTYDNIQVR